MVEDENGRSIEVTPLDFLEAVYCNPNLPLATRLRAAIEVAPYKHPKLSAAAIGHFNGDGFAEQPERAIARSQSTVINALPAPELPPSVASKPFSRPNYRRF
jgi:hypothetical protein